MNEPSTDVTENGAALRLAALAKLVSTGYDEVRQAFPAHEPLGYTLFLGKHYAQPAPAVLMLGLNPGLSDKNSNAEPQSENWLLEGKRPKFSYWRNARYFFNNCDGALRSAMEMATFSFCCPYRTRSWKLPVAHRRALMTAARRTLQQVMEDCAPRFVLLAGSRTEEVFGHVLGADLVSGAVSDGPYTSGKYRSRAIHATWQGRPLTVCQGPHFSRANEKPKLRECAAWLSGILAQ